MGKSDDRRESRYFTGDEDELQQIKNLERLQKFAKQKRLRENFKRFSRIFVFSLIIVGFAILILNVFFVVKNVEIIGSTHYSKDRIISVCGIEDGQSLYSVGSREMKLLSSRLAYIKSARLTRKLPDTLVITVTEDTPVYMCELYGEYFVLSEELRVLHRVFDKTELEGMGLVELVFPEINSVIVGSYVEFAADSAEKYVKAYLDALENSNIFEITTAFDLRDRFDLSMICDGRYLVDLGNGDELNTKLTAVYGMLQSEVFSDGVPATIDAKDPSECPVIKNPEAVIEFDRYK